eukprot:SAG31_NODE_5603_length_2426_cov_4.864633_2_plen_70_part_00
MADDKEKAASGWFGGWFGGGGGTKAVVGGELEMYYDEDKKRWIDPVCHSSETRPTRPPCLKTASTWCLI